MITIHTDQFDDFQIIKVIGEVDASSSIHLDNKLSEAITSNKKILVDCHDLKYISSAGLGVFMSYIHEMEESEIKMVLFGLSNKVKNVFQILGLDQLIKMVDTKEDAKKLVNAL
jgi:anti-sigma B factor antagonist